MNNWIALIITFAAALGWLRLMDFFAHRGWIESRLSRKIIHIGTGPIFVLCWLLFDDISAARWMAALVPFAITVQFALIGLGIMKDEASVKAMSRTGDPKEILRGPLFYGIVFVVMTLVFWKDSPVGIIALMLMCGGDGIADVVGRRVKSAKLPWSREKSVVGSLAVFAGGWLLAVLVVAIFVSAGVFGGSSTSYFFPIAIIAFVGMLVESLPFREVDNLTVTIAAVFLGMFLF
ncbi:MAG: phosphatidate cytidylyltransferase [Anaerolineae bacterium]|jgi:phytol kinase|nr:phosphatidate cytidylyltransferase [Anaerolineae bacterium]MBT7071242.1 phosphatidate cytidylyltransferase [Anaerolineae bacterium]MBT7324175.1 phosphatidate cytidylyltransferase [Anaerolineae bacterium]